MTLKRSYLSAALASALVLTYLGSRLYALDRLPIFLDEGMHIQWAQQTLRGQFDAGWLDGKWLFIKILAGFLILPLQPIVAARLSSVLAGLVSLAACYATGKLLFSRAAGWIAAALYLLVPFTLFYDRMALADGWLMALGACILWLSILAVRSRKLIYPITLGVFLLLAMLAKLPGALYISIPPLAVLCLAPRRDWTRVMLRVAPVLLLAGLVFLVLVKRQAGMPLVESKVAPSFASFLVRNLGQATGWLWGLLSPPIVVLALMAAALSFVRKGDSGLRFLTLVCLANVLPYILISAIWYPRYLLFVALPVCLLVGGFLAGAVPALGQRLRQAFEARQIHARVWLILVAILILCASLLLPLFLDFQVLLMPEQAALPPLERYQYVSGWASGYGLAELSSYLREVGRSSPSGINVVRFANFGPTYPALDVLVEGDDAIRLYLLDFAQPGGTEWLRNLASQGRTLLVIDAPRLSSHLWDDLGLGRYMDSRHMVWSYTKPGGNTRLEAWEIPAPGDPP